MECDVCCKTFVSKRHLKEHSKIHVDECKRYNCTLCIRSCFIEANLCAHVRGAHEGSCTTLCGKKIDWFLKYHRHQRKCMDCENVWIEKRHKKNAIMSKAKHYFLHSVFLPFYALNMLSSKACLLSWFSDCHIAKKYFADFLNKTFWTLLYDVFIDKLRNYLRVMRSHCSAEIGDLKLVYFLAIRGPTSSKSLSNHSTDI